MEKYQKYLPTAIVAALIAIALFMSYSTISPLITKKIEVTEQYEAVQAKLKDAEEKLAVVNEKLKQLKETSIDNSKKIYYPTEADIDKESLFFTLYTDMIDIAKQNNIKIRSIDYKYYPSDDPFVSQGGKENYFVCDLDMKLISNYRDLRNFLEALFQYSYYLKFNKISIVPHQTDKRILLSDFSVRLYAHTDIEKPLTEGPEI